MQLLIDTASNRFTAVALVDGAQIIRRRTMTTPFRQSERLLGLIDHVKGTAIISKIVVVSGPGDFSALRIGISTANALAFAWNVPVVGIQIPEEFATTKRLAYVLAQQGKPLSKSKGGTWVTPVYGKEPNIRMKK
jgi:tRNA threonylcarbamoyladenosine biosynthesis protein TsaB